MSHAPCGQKSLLRNVKAAPGRGRGTYAFITWERMDHDDQKRGTPPEPSKTGPVGKGRATERLRNRRRRLRKERSL